MQEVVLPQPPSSCEAASMAETTWTYDIPDFSPLTIFSATTSNSPAIIPNLASSWQQSCPIGNTTSLGDNICDQSSVHTTTSTGASVTINFYGQGVQMFGGVSQGATYQVILDGGSPTNGNVTGSALVQLTNLKQREHSVTISAQGGGSLSYTGATVEVGTGLTDATVNRQILQDDDSTINYIGGNSWSVATFDEFRIPHSGSNSTWHQLSPGSAGSYSFEITGQAVFVYGTTWSFALSAYHVSVDGAAPVLNYGNSSLANTIFGSITTDGLYYFNANLNGTHTFVIDNSNGAGQLGIDYLEVVSYSGGTPIASSSSTTSGNPDAGASSSHHSKSIVGPVVGGVIGGLVLIAAICWLLYRRSKGRQASESLDAPQDVDDKALDLTVTTIVPFTSRPSTSVATEFDPYHPNSISSSLPDSAPQTKGLAVSDLGPIPIAVSSPRNEKARTTGVGSIGSTSAMSDATSGRAVSPPVGGISNPAALVRELELALARARANAGLDESESSAAAPADEQSMSEIRALRRDLNNLLQLMDTSGPTNVAPPQYES